MVIWAYGHSLGHVVLWAFWHLGICACGYLGTLPFWHMAIWAFEHSFVQFVHLGVLGVWAFVHSGI